MLLIALSAALPAAQAVFQYRLPVTWIERDQTRSGRALLWVPANAAVIRGVLLCGHVVVEGDVVRDPVIRAACARHGLGIVYVTANLGNLDVPGLMTALATHSGYAELASVPWIPFGHSAGGGPALQLAHTAPDRVIGVVQFRGGMPDASSTIPRGLPTLAMMAEFDEHWGTMREDNGKESWHRAQTYIAGFRAADPGNLGAFVVEPGAGHFAWSAANARLLAAWIDGVMPLRLPAASSDERPALRAIDPAEGWLLGFDLTAPMATAYNDWPGDPATASWLPDAATAAVALTYHDGISGLRDQFLAWRDPVWIDAGVRHFFTSPQWHGEGATVRCSPVFRSTMPPQEGGQGPRWPDAGSPAGNNGAPITVRVVSGSAVAGPGPQEFTLALDAVYDDPSQRIVFIASAPGGEGFRPTNLIGMMPRGFKGLTSGLEQILTFPELPPMHVGNDPLVLGASSDRGLPVSYHVAYGPAVIEHGKLVLSEIPARANYPITIEVAAWQMGRATGQAVRMARPIRRTVTLNAP